MIPLGYERGFGLLKERLAIRSPAVVLGLNIQRIRKRRGMTQADLAAAIGYTQAGICMIEGAERDTKIMTLRRIKRALGCSWSNLLRGV